MVVAVLCGPTQFLEGLWSLWSWMSHLSPYMSAVLLFDGKTTPQQQMLFEKLFPNGNLLELDGFLKQRPLPDYMRRFVAGHWVAKKLAAVFELQKEMDVLYSDCDVIVFKKPTDIINQIASGKSFYMFDSGYTLDPWFCRRAEQIGISVSNHLNAGLVYVPKELMKETLLKSMLWDWQPSFNHHFSEQTLFGSILLASKNSSPLPQNRYVLSNQGFLFGSGIWIAARWYAVIMPGRSGTGCIYRPTLFC